MIQNGDYCVVRDFSLYPELCFVADSAVGKDGTILIQTADSRKRVRPSSLSLLNTVREGDKVFLKSFKKDHKYTIKSLRYFKGIWIQTDTGEWFRQEEIVPCLKNS